MYSSTNVHGRSTLRQAVEPRSDQSDKIIVAFLHLVCSFKARPLVPGTPQQLGIDCCGTGCAEVAFRRRAFASKVVCSLVGVARQAGLFKYHSDLFVVAGWTRRKAFEDSCVWLLEIRRSRLTRITSQKWRRHTAKCCGGAVLKRV